MQNYNYILGHFYIKPLHQIVRVATPDSDQSYYNEESDQPHGLFNQKRHLFYAKVDIQVGLSSTTIPTELFNWNNGPSALISLNKSKKVNFYTYTGRQSIKQVHHPRILTHNRFNGMGSVPRDPKTVLTSAYKLFPLMTGPRTLFE